MFLLILFRFIYLFMHSWCTESDNPGPSSNMSVVDSQEMSTLDVTDDLVPSLQVNTINLLLEL